MSVTFTRFAGAGLFGLFIFASGFWLSRAGKPYSDLLFNVHKLIALAALALFIFTLHRVNQETPLSTLEWVVAIVAVLSFIGLFATGGLSSALDSVPQIVLTIHHITPYLAVISAGLTLILLSRK